VSAFGACAEFDAAEAYIDEKRVSSVGAAEAACAARIHAER
jgi:hypothetical protein